MYRYIVSVQQLVEKDKENYGEYAFLQLSYSIYEYLSCSLLSDVVTIRARQDVVAELMESPELFFPLQSVLSQCLSLDSLLTMIIQLKRHPANVKFAEAKITNVIYLKHVMQIIPPLKDLLKKCTSSLLTSYTQVQPKRSLFACTFTRFDMQQLLSLMIHIEIIQ